MATPPPLIYTDDNSLTSAAVTVTSGYSGKLQASNYGSAVVTIDASSRTKAIDITGNTKNNSIKGGSGNDTLSGGTGNDTLTGGNGKDLFVYASGNDVITDYTAGQDTLKISSGSISGYSFSGDDAIFTIGKGSVTVSGGKQTAITVIDSKKKTFTYQNGLIQDNSAVAKAKAVTVTAANSGTVTAADYGAAVVTIDASSRTAAVNITGNTKNNKIIGTAGNDTLSGGSGKNTLTGGKGNDLFIYSGGNDVITDYTSGDDTIQIASGAISSYSVSSKDLSLKIGKNTLKVTGGKTATLTILDAENNVNVYQGGLIYGGEIASATALSVTSVYGNTLSSYGANVEVIDASERSKALNITGNAKANQITGTKKNDKIDGGAGADTIEGGKGNDVLTGGAGNDIFIYTDGDGKDTITDYSAGDVISLSGDYNISYSYSSAKGGTSTFKIGKSGSIAVKNSANAVVTLVGANGEASIGIKNSFLAVNDIPGFSPGSGTNETVYVTVPAETVNVTLPAETVTVGGGENVTVEVTLPAETVTVGGGEEVTVTVEAEPVTVTIGGGGNGSGSVITGDSGANTLIGTAGNDTLIGGAGNDIFVYTGGNDFDIITDYGTGSDKISIGSSGISNGMLIGNDVYFAIGGGMLKLNGAKGKPVSIASNSGESVYANGAFVSESINPNGATVTLDASLSSWSEFKLETYNETASVTAVNIDGSALRNPIYINGDDNANIIWAGKSGGNIYALEGNDTIFCGNGNDEIYYTKYGGSDVIYSFQTGDRLDLSAHLDSNSDDHFQNFSFSGNDVILNLRSGEKITLKDAKDQRISLSSYYEDYNGLGWHEINNTVGRVTITSGSATLANNYVGYFDVSNYAESIKNVNAASVTSKVNIYGDDSANVIYAGREGGSIFGGEGNDTIYCGRGTDNIRYDAYGGSDVIYNFQTGDKIHFSTSEYEAKFKNISFSGNDVIINLESGEKITLKDAKDQRIHIDGYYTDHNGTNWHTIDNTVGKVTITSGNATLASDYDGDYFDVSNYAASIKNIDASVVKEQVNLYGNDSANVIYAGRAGGGIYAGKGNDTIYCGRAKDYIYHGRSSGNDVIYNIGKDDNIFFDYCSAENVSVKGSDVIITTDYDDTITVKNGASVNFKIGYNDWQNYTVSSSADIIEDFWFTEDNNFVSSGGDLDSIVDESNSLANLNFNSVDADNIFAQDKPDVTFTNDK